MKKLLPLCILISAILFHSCEKDTIDKDVIRTLTIDETTHAFINDNGTRYVENTLTSQQDKHVYKLTMVKGIQYRISATQPGTSIAQIRLTLVNSKQDTLSESLNESPSKSLILINSPETTSYYLIVNLQKRTNPAFNYHLYFEEIVDDAISFSGLNWNKSGTWNISNSNSIELTNSDSYIYRHLKLLSSVTGNPNLTFVIQTSSISSTSFGLILDASDDFFQFGEWAYELSGSGNAFLAFKDNMNYTVIKLATGSMSLDWNTLVGINMDFLTGIKVELKFTLGQYYIYLNNTPLRSIKGSLQNFNILIQDRGAGKTTIKDFQLVN